MEKRNRPSARARARAQVNGEYPPDAPVAPAPRYVTRPAYSFDDLQKAHPDWKIAMERLARCGRGTTHYIALLEIHPVAFDNLLRDSKEFLEHYQFCLNLQKMWLEDQGLDNLKTREFNTPTWMAFMVNQHGWRSANSRAELAGDSKAPLTVETRLASATDAEINEQLGIPTD